MNDAEITVDAGKAKPFAGMEDPEVRRKVDELKRLHRERRPLSLAVARMLFVEYNVHPSVALVRRLTDKGSMSDINNDLKLFWDDVRDKSVNRIKGVDLPEALLADAGKVVASLWTLAKEHAERELQPVRDELVAQTTAATASVAMAEERVRVARDEAAKADEAAIQARQERDQARADHQALVSAHDIERAGLQQALASAQAEVAHWQQQHADAEAARAKSEEAYLRDLDEQRKARAESERRLEGELRFAKLQIDESRQTARDLREELKQVKDERTVEEAVNRQQRNAMNGVLGELQLKVGELTGRLQSVTAERDRLHLIIKARLKVKEN